MSTLDDDELGKHSIAILGPSDLGRNPFQSLKKLTAGFCDPFNPRNDDERTAESYEDSPRSNYYGGTNRVCTAASTATVRKSNLGQNEDVISRGINVPTLPLPTISESLSIPSLPPLRNQKAARLVSDITIDSTSSAPAWVPDESGPEIELSKRVTRQRRKHALQVFLASVVFVLAAIITLRKLGCTNIADFDAPIPPIFLSISSSDATTKLYQWIHVFEKPEIGIKEVQKLKAIPAAPKKALKAFNGQPKDARKRNYFRAIISRVKHFLFLRQKRDDCYVGSDVTEELGFDPENDNVPEVVAIFETHGTGEL